MKWILLTSAQFYPLDLFNLRLIITLSVMIPEGASLCFQLDAFDEMHPVIWSREALEHEILKILPWLIYRFCRLWKFSYKRGAIQTEVSMLKPLKRRGIAYAFISDAAPFHLRFSSPEVIKKDLPSRVPL